MIIGTSGHVDHGKTALVKALTGVETDRLKEEKTREVMGASFRPDKSCRRAQALAQFRNSVSSRGRDRENPGIRQPRRLR
jgi:translation initiation factor 2 gamma subunit (eIF-2gamma)